MGRCGHKAEFGLRLYGQVVVESGENNRQVRVFFFTLDFRVFVSASENECLIGVWGRHSAGFVGTLYAHSWADVCPTSLRIIRFSWVSLTCVV